MLVHLRLDSAAKLTIITSSYLMISSTTQNLCSSFVRLQNTNLMSIRALVTDCIPYSRRRKFRRMYWSRSVMIPMSICRLSSSEEEFEAGCSSEGGQISETGLLIKAQLILRSAASEYYFVDGSYGTKEQDENDEMPTAAVRRRRLCSRLMMMMISLIKMIMAGGALDLDPSFQAWLLES
ncbi:hypothetical protein CRG98_017157 [Punica granatum]|uniref:Uncharacterized protein n=1 Tax=Punica granatum TaxID=22663 RepID=A0A2I0K1B9_PUNGR|nr:hypothetical protein CRG98_017157 [Punica granatum]